MKTLFNLRNLIMVVAMTMVMIFVSISSFSQESKVWLTIDNPNNVPVANASGNLASSDISFNIAIASLNITDVQKALPSSRSASLMNVYEVTCDCDLVDLYTMLSNEVNAVSKVEYGPVYKFLATPNDYDLIPDHYALDIIGAEDAWNVTTGDSSVVIAITDQNYNVNHGELIGQYVYYDTTNVLSTGHGTAVSIVASGASNNLLFKSSIGYNTSLGLYRMNYNEMLYASYDGAKVVNLSWTSGCAFNNYQQEAIDEAYNNGTFIIASAGNGSTCGGPENLVYPAAFNNVFSVTSIGPSDNHQRIIGDPNSTHQHNATVDMSAPGYNVYISPAPTWETTGSGTSYAAPFVSGTVGLMLSINPCLTNTDIEYILKNSSTYIDDLNPAYAGLIGEGRLNAGAAVEMAQGYNEIILTSTNSSSCGSYGGQIDVSIAGGNEPFSTEWSNGSTELNLTDLASGSYTLTVTGAMGCSVDTTITVGTYTPTVFEGDVQHVTCNGDANGAIDITIIEGTPDYEYEWDHGYITEDITDLVAGTYRVKITDGNGCIVYGSYSVLEPQVLTATMEVLQSTVTSGDIDVTISGGTAPYSFAWNTGDVTEDLLGVPSGYYELAVVDYNGCEVSVSETIQDLGNVSVNEFEQTNISVFPNPMSVSATVTWDNNEINTIIVLNANGQLVQSNDVSFKNSYKIQRLNSGVYFIILTDGNNNTYTERLIVK